MIYPSLNTVSRLAGQYNRIPIYRGLNLKEPGLLMLLKSLRRERDIIFLESARQNKKISRFSYLCLRPKKTISFKPPHIVERSGECTKIVSRDFFTHLKEELHQYSSPAYPQFGTFNGGLVGYLGFETVNYTGILRSELKENTRLPLATLAVIDNFICYDNRYDRYTIATSLYPERGESIDVQYHRAVEHLEELESDIIAKIKETSLPYIPSHAEPLEFGFRETREQFTSKVREVKQLINDGEALQVVLSMRADIREPIDPYRFYLRLRQLNPSPYMFFLKFDELTITGSSPEIHVKVERDSVILKPIAGTIARGKTRAENKQNRLDLSNNPKERAEHLMLVDLARNDLSRIGTPGSVEVKQFMLPEDYSHVIHLVSTVEATLKSGLDAVDVMRETFPAGTVSGAPKVRALELIDAFEDHPRDVYAGAIGYFGYNGHMDTCITIRTAVFSPEESYIQAGAGIVYDSIPESEYHEILHKLRALTVSLPYARTEYEEVSHVLHSR
jgi:anthranilate synthase component 1